MRIFLAGSAALLAGALITRAQRESPALALSIGNLLIATAYAQESWAPAPAAQPAPTAPKQKYFSDMAALCDRNYEGENYNGAAESCGEAAEHGDANAQYRLGTMYAHGEGVDQNYNEAVEWFKKAANQGNVPAQATLGAMYYNGDGVKRDYGEALNWFKKAADQGDPDAEYNIGAMYHNGKGVERDYEKALDWFRKAAAKGSELGRRMVTKMTGEGR